MINAAISYCKLKNIMKLTLWINKTLPMYNYLKKIGITEIPVDVFFVIKFLNNKYQLQDIENFDNWFITMSDSENY